MVSNDKAQRDTNGKGESAMKRFGRVLGVYLAFLFLVWGIAVVGTQLARGDEADLPVGASIAAIGLTYFWFQFRPLSGK
jgi:hypothetical protein